MTKFTRRILKGLRLESEGAARAVMKQSHAFRHASTIVLCFYVYQMTALTNAFSRWEQWSNTAFVDPQWIVKVLNDLLPGYAVTVCNGLLVLGTVSAVLFYKKRWARLAFFLGSYLSLALANSHGKIDHGGFLTLFLAFVLVFLPDGGRSASRTTRQKYLTVFIAAQAVVLSIYSLAGFWKVFAAFETKPFGVVSLFSVGAFPAQIAASLIEKQAESGAGLFLIAHPHLAWMVGILGIFFEFFALAALRRPRMHVVFGTALIFMHLGAILFMSIFFTSNIIYLALFLVASPFSPDFNLRQSLAALPVAGWMLPSRWRTTILASAPKKIPFTGSGQVLTPRRTARAP